MKPKTFDHEWLLTGTETERVERPNGRFYKAKDGSLYPSVTTILGSLPKPGIKRWEDRVGIVEANRIKRTAAARGTRLHEVVDPYLKNDPSGFTKADPIARHNFLEVQPFLDEIEKVYAVENMLVSDYLKAGGTTDSAVLFRGKRSILDLKTARKAKKPSWIKDYFLQTSLYSVMLEEMTGVPFPQLVIVIAVEGSTAQCFVERRDSHVHDAVAVVREYHERTRCATT